MASAAQPPAPGAARLQDADVVINSWRTFSGVYKARRSIFRTKWTRLSNARKIGIVKNHWRPLVMPTRHRPDLDNAALWRASGSRKLLRPLPIDEPAMDNLLWPYFNIETITNPDMALLQLMESRSDLHPRVFSRLDLINPVNKRIQMHFGYDIKYSQWTDTTQFADIDPRGNVDDTDSSYGDLVPVSNAGIMDALKSIDSFSEREGIRVIKVQKQIYSFLSGVCDEVLASTATGRGAAPRAGTGETAEPPGDDWETAEADFLSKPLLDFEPSDPANGEALQRYLKLHHDLDPYSHPTEVDWEYLSVLAGHRLRVSEDRLRGLKEDPGKFLDFLQQVRDHSQFMLSFHPSNLGDTLVEKGTDLANKQRCSQHIKTALVTLTDAVDTWQAIFTLVEKLRAMRQDYDGPHVDLLENSDEYAANILGIIRAGIHYRANSFELLRAIQCSQAMRNYFRVSEQTFDVEALGPQKPNNNAERDLSALASTLSSDTARDVFGEWTLFEEIHTLIQANARIRTPYLAAIAEDLNSLSSVMLVLERVWHSTGRYDLDLNSLDLVRGGLDYAQPLERLRNLDASDTNGVLQNLVSDHLKRPLQNNYAFKTRGRMTRRDYDANENAVQNLFAFWDAAEVMLRAEDVGALSDTVRDLLETAQPLTVTRPDRRASATARTTAAGTGAVASSFPTGGDDTPRMTFEERRVKEKTRPEFALTLAPPPAAAAAAAAIIYPNIQLPLRHYNTIQILMGPGTVARPGTIAWGAVVGCLVAMGFSYNTGQGSARVFEPSAALMDSQVSLFLPIVAPLPIPIHRVKFSSLSDGVVVLTCSQGINTPVSRHEKDPWNTNTARTWCLNRRYGLAKYGWTIDKFVVL